MLLRLGKTVVDHHAVTVVTVVRPAPGDPEAVCVGGPGLGLVSTGLLPERFGDVARAVQDAGCAPDDMGVIEVKGEDDPLVFDVKPADDPIVTLEPEPARRLVDALKRYKATPRGAAVLANATELATDFIEQELGRTADASGEPVGLSAEDEDCQIKAARFEHAFKAYQRVYHLDGEDDPISLLIDMQHWCRLNRCSFQREVAGATDIFMDECQRNGLKFNLTAAEAGQHSQKRTAGWWDKEMAYLDALDKRIAQVDEELAPLAAHRHPQLQETEECSSSSETST